MTVVSADEQAIRNRLGIPDDARKVILFGESSHWDPDWLFTSEKYYRRFIQGNLDDAVAMLKREPARVYSIECIFFLRMYWERNPAMQPAIRDLVNSGRLRLTSSGITTSDSLIPRPEAILRDLLMGQEWLRRQGMTQEPRLAYFTDSFGTSPGLPSLLKAAGFDWTAFTRIDGMYFAGCDALPPSKFPLPGSSAERLLKKERSLEFVWRDPNGAEVLSHWNAFTYGQGDMLGYGGVNRVYLFPAAYPSRGRTHVRRMITSFADQLFPLAHTPYVFCPIGFDFVAPTPSLTTLLDRYNQLDYPTTGIWAVNCGMDDLFLLVEHYRKDLPVVEMDPLPYWTGFYSARPALKHLCHQAVDQLQTIESALFLEKDRDRCKAAADKVERLWQEALVSNHHDFITGTSPDKVVEGEQIPLMENILVKTSAMLNGVRSPIKEKKGGIFRRTGSPTWERKGHKISVRTKHYLAELDETKGGCIVSLRDQAGKPVLLDGCLANLVMVRESGGLWRMGNELAGGIFTDAASADKQKTILEASWGDGRLQFTSTHTFLGEKIVRTLQFTDDEPCILVTVTGRAPIRHTILLRNQLPFQPGELVMDNPGTFIVRPIERHYKPTFWPVQRIFFTLSEEENNGVVFQFGEPGAAAVNARNEVDLIALRNAELERYFGWLPMPGQPAAGHEKRIYSAVFGIHFLKPDKRRSLATVRQICTLHASMMTGTLSRQWIDRCVKVSDGNIETIALKPASCGDGWIVRLMALERPAAAFSITLVNAKIAKAWLCDARERNIQALPIQDGKLMLRMRAAFATIRLIVK